MSPVRIGAAIAPLVVSTGCFQPPSPEACVASVDPELLALDLVGDPPEDVFRLEVESDLRIATINVGNGVNRHGDPYALRIGWQAYEDEMGAKIRALRPDLVALQEVLPRHTCLRPGPDDSDVAWEQDERRTCFTADQRPDAVRRLLGPDYSIVCDAVKSVDCFGVHRDFGTIVGLDPGGYEAAWEQTMPLPEGFALCDYLDLGCRPKRRACDQESSVAWLDVQTHRGVLVRVVHLHPAAFADACREHQLEQAFARARERPEGAEVLVIGDFNSDPDRLNVPVEEVLYYANVGPGRALHEHDERDAACARVPTAPLDVAAIDHVITSFARGFCRVHERRRSLGHEDELGRFDDDFSRWDELPGGRSHEARMDHNAVTCDLAWTPTPG